MDPNAQTFDFFVEGNAVTWTQPNGIGSNVPAGRSLPQSLDWIGFGVESFGGAATTIGGLFDDIVVSGVRVGCGTAPVTTDNPTTSTTDPTTTTTVTSTSTTQASTTSTSCGYIPQTCGRPLTRMHGLRESKNLGQFEEIQLYFHCRGRNPTKCTGLEKPCTCSSPPCTCRGEEPPTSTSASTTSTIASTTTSTSASTTSTTASTTTSPTPTTTTP